MNLRNVTILAPVLLLAAFFLQSYFHCLVFNNKPELIPLGMVLFTSLIGWPLAVLFLITLFVWNRVSCIILLLSAMIYGVLWFSALTSMYGNPQLVSGLDLLLVPIIMTMWMIPFWLLAIGLEIYFWVTPGTEAAHSFLALLEKENMKGKMQ